MKTKEEIWENYLNDPDCNVFDAMEAYAQQFKDEISKLKQEKEELQKQIEKYKNPLRDLGNY